MSTPIDSEQPAADSNDPFGLGAAWPDSSTVFGVVQKRKYRLDHELAVMGGVFPVDPYAKAVTAGLGYTVHLTDSVAWELVRASYAFNVHTTLRKKLEMTALAQSGQALRLPELQWLVASRLVLKPLYGKQAWFNTQVMHFEASLSAGPALLSRSAPARGLGLGMDVGAGLRMWLSPAWSLRFDLGELVFVDQQGGRVRPRQAIHVDFGLAASFGGES